MPRRRLTIIERMSLAGAIGVLAVGSAVPARVADAAGGPTAEEVIQRVMLTIAEIPEVVSADAEFKLRIKKSPGDPPDCVFRGTVTLVNRQPTIKIEEQTTGLLCWAVNRFVLGRQFQPRERLESFLSRFEFDVLGEKLVGNDRYYLVAGRAKDPKTKPSTMVGWIDFERGLLIEGTVKYAWGSIDNEERYARVENMWMLTHQYLYTARFDVSMEILYHNFRFGPQ
jgi:hypothetical protein